MSQKEVLLTYEGLKKLEEELEELKTVKRREVAERIKIALGFGDLSENSEYDEAKNEQAQVEMRIIDLENKLRNVKLIDEDDIDTKTVQVGSKVQILDIEYDEKIEYTIVGSTEVDLDGNKISNESPIGSALIGKKKNEVAEVQAPAVMLSFKILKISKAV
jgi:transcription elongation factor GreA